MNNLPFISLIILIMLPVSLWADRSETGSPRLMQGPMLGAVTQHSINVWARFSHAGPVTIEYATDAYFSSRIGRVEAVASRDTDLCVVFTIESLQPQTRYYYRFRIGEEKPKYLKQSPPPSFVTAPENPARFTVGLGSCVRFQEDRIQDIWLQVANHRPDLFFWLGDNIYGDSQNPEILAEEYRRQRDVGYLQPVIRNIPQLAVWDDHDFGLNDHDRENPIKEGALEVFQRYWANGEYGLPDTPGIFRSYSYGGVDFFLLDGRYYRDPYFVPDSESKTLLGKAQLAWLKEALMASDAPFKVLVCGSGWTSLKGNDGDSWSSMLTERNALFDWITDREIEGVVLVSGDVHRSELNAIPWSERGGYDFYELVSSPLAQGPSDNLRPEIWEIYLREPVRTSNFGMLEFDLTVEDPVLHYRVIDSLGTQHFDGFSVRASELKNGISSWKSKAREEVIQKHQQYLKANPDLR